MGAAALSDVSPVLAGSIWQVEPAFEEYVPMDGNYPQPIVYGDFNIVSPYML